MDVSKGIWSIPSWNEHIRKDSNSTLGKTYDASGLPSGHRHHNKINKRGYIYKKHAVLSERELDEFRTVLCLDHSIGNDHEADSCPHSHCLTWQRRNPREFTYSYSLCPDIEFVRKGSKMQLVRRCGKGRMCFFAHSKEEELYHPAVYKTRMCNSYPKCQRYYCPFVHHASEKRPLINRSTEEIGIETKSVSSTSFSGFEERTISESTRIPPGLEPQSVLEQLIFLPSLCSGRPLQQSELRHLVSFIKALQNSPPRPDDDESATPCWSGTDSSPRWSGPEFKYTGLSQGVDFYYGLGKRFFDNEAGFRVCSWNDAHGL